MYFHKCIPVHMCVSTYFCIRVHTPQMRDVLQQAEQIAVFDLANLSGIKTHSLQTRHLNHLGGRIRGPMND